MVVRLTARGPTQGDIVAPIPRPATGKQVTMPQGIAIARLANDKFVEIWHQLDYLGLLRQLRRCFSVTKDRPASDLALAYW